MPRDASRGYSLGDGGQVGAMDPRGAIHEPCEMAIVHVQDPMKTNAQGIEVMAAPSIRREMASRRNQIARLQIVWLFGEEAAGIAAPHARVNGSVDQVDAGNTR